MNVTERDFSIDYIKGIAILMVIVFHCLMSYSLKIGGILHIEQAVPLFLIASAYITFKKIKSNNQGNSYFDKNNIRKVVKRIFLPFLIFELLIVIISLIKKDFSLLSFMLSGGKGMGSYYPWLYLQYWLMLPFAYSLLTKLNNWGGY
jgi:fucose 4-O-acetylase-like acetyltransferase